MNAGAAVIADLLERFPHLEACRGPITAACELICGSFHRGGKLLLCGNGGSAADCEHIAGELGKGFRSPRPLTAQERAAFAARFPGEDRLPSSLQRAIPVIPLVSSISLATAFANDAAPDLVFAQQVWGLAGPGDVLWSLTTSGSSANIIAAARTAAVRGATNLVMTGNAAGPLDDIAATVIHVPAAETYHVQELHLPVYHAICAAVEIELFG